VIHPMQYELERAYHLRCEGHAARQRLIAEAEQGADEAAPGRPNLGIAGRVRWHLLTSRLPLHLGLRLTGIDGAE
jgi:hypothetical protein